MPEPEVDPAIASFMPVHISAVFLYNSPNYLGDSYGLDFDDDGFTDFVFSASADNMGNGQVIQDLKINGYWGAQVVFELVPDSICNQSDSLCIDVSFNRAFNFNLDDTITTSMNYANHAFFTKRWVPDLGSGFDSQSDGTLIGETFYVGGKKGNKLIWIKVHIMGYSNMEILDFGCVENQNEIIAGA